MVSGITSATNNWSPNVPVETSSVQQARLEQGRCDRQNRDHGCHERRQETLARLLEEQPHPRPGVLEGRHERRRGNQPHRPSAALSSGAASGLFGGSTASLLNIHPTGNRQREHQQRGGGAEQVDEQPAEELSDPGRPNGETGFHSNHLGRSVLEPQRLSHQQDGHVRPQRFLG